MWRLFSFIKTTKITQLLMKNGKLSSGRMTKHFRAKFFFIKDRIDSKEIRVVQSN